MGYTGSLSPFSTQTTDDLRKWVAGISNGLSFAGLVNTNATGSINPNTITAVTSSNASYGFDVFRFDDSLQTTAPIFVRLEYRNRPVAPPNANAPALDITVGTTHNGSGVVSGQTRSFSLYYTGGTNDRTIQSSIFAAGDGWMNMALWYTLAGSMGLNSWFLNIERTLDANGNITPEGFSVHLIGSENGTDIRSAYIPMSGALPPTQTRWGILRSPAGELTYTNGQVIPGRVYHMNGSVLPVPLQSILLPASILTMTYDLIPYSPFTGVDGVYFRLNTSTYLSANGIDGRLLMRIQ